MPNDTAFKQAWEKWIASEDGIKATEFSTLAPGPYLENRLWSAFNAAWNRHTRYRSALERIRDGAPPSDWEPYDSWNDPVDVDLSNTGDWHDHGFKMGQRWAGEIATEALEADDE